MLCYEALSRLTPSPIVELNRAVAISMATGPDTALRIVDELAEDDALRGSHLLPSIRGELLARLVRTEEARTELRIAASLCSNDRTRAVLGEKAASM